MQSNVFDLYNKSATKNGVEPIVARISVSEFRKNIATMLAEVEVSGVTLILTRRGKDIMKLVPTSPPPTYATLEDMLQAVVKKKKKISR
jgi:antitoxin (DNA-binding transcriptional repressor) of toxin-antitoxin stability system